jgi:hypothetical protein
MSVLTLDLGTQCGWALLRPEGIVSGSESFKPGRHEGGGMRFLRFSRFLDRLHEDPITEIYYEEVRGHKGIDAAHIYGGLLGQLSAWCEHRQIPYQGIPVGTIKRHITGKGNAGKAAVIDAIKAIGFEPVDDNEADALAIMDYVRFIGSSPFSLRGRDGLG